MSWPYSGAAGGAIRGAVGLLHADIRTERNDRLRFVFAQERDVWLMNDDLSALSAGFDKDHVGKGCAERSRVDGALNRLECWDAVCVCPVFFGK